MPSPHLNQEETNSGSVREPFVTMTKLNFKGSWNELKGKLKQKYAQLTDDDLAQVNGNREQLEGILQKRYGYAKDQAKQELDRWSDTL